MAINAFRGDALPLAKIVRYKAPANVIGVQPTISVNNKEITWPDWNSGTMADDINALEWPELEDITASVDNGDLLLTGIEDDDWQIDLAITPTVTTEFTQGTEPDNQVTRIDFDGATGGTFTITLDGETTGNITQGDLSGARTAIDLLTSFTSTDYTLTEIDEDTWQIEFEGTYAASSVAVSVDGANLTKPVGTLVISRLSDAVVARHEVFQIAFAETDVDGKTLSIDGNSFDIAKEMTRQDIEDVCNELCTDGGVKVYGGWVGAGDVAAMYVIEFANSPGTIRHDTANFSFENANEWSSLYSNKAGEEGVHYEGMVAETSAQTDELLMFDTTEGDIELLLSPKQGTKTPTAVTITQGMSTSAIQTALDDAARMNYWTVFETGYWVATSAGDDTDGQTSQYVRFARYNAGTRNNLDVENIVIQQTGGAGTFRRLADGGTNTAGAEFNVYHQGGVTGGNFTLELEEGTTGTVAYNASAATFQTAVQAVRAAATVASGSGTAGDPWILNNGTTSPGSDQTPTAVTTFTGLANASSSTQEEHTTGTSATMRIVVSPRAASGAYLLTYGTEGPISFDYNLNATTFKTELEKFPSLSTSGDTAVTYDSESGLYVITFQGALANSIVNELKVGTSTLATATDESNQTLDQRPTGPKDFSNPKNWTLLRLPQTSDDVVVDDTPENIEYGLRQYTPFTGSASTDKLTCTKGHDFVEGQVVRVFVGTGDTLPAPLAVATDYYVVNVDQAAKTIQLATAAAAAPINLTDSGTGSSFHVGMRVNSLRTTAAATADIGRPEQATGFREYRPRYLQIGVEDTVDVGEGVGQGAGLTRMDFLDSPPIVRILATAGSTEDNYPAFNALAQSTGLRFAVMGGNAGLAAGDDETAQVEDIGLHGGESQFGEVHLTTDFYHTGGTWSSRKLTLSGELRSNG